jgi:putative membrane protein
LISFVLKRYNAVTTAIIIGFISGSLGVVWPWKQTIYKLNELGKPLLDSNQHKIILNYQRYIPSIQDAATWWAIFWMGIGFVFLMALEGYANRQKK